jgi:hypothetical protein
VSPAEELREAGSRAIILSLLTVQTRPLAFALLIMEHQLPVSELSVHNAIALSINLIPK